MALSTVIRVNTSEWSAALRQYLPRSSRALGELLNQAGYNISTTAVAVTKRGDRRRIRNELMAPSRIAPSAPLAAILINSMPATARMKLSPKGDRGLYGKDMRVAVELFVQRRADAVNFLRAGWLPAVFKFALAIGKAPRENAVRFMARFGSHGGATITRHPWRPFAVFWNEAFSRYTSTEKGYKFAQEGLQKAINQDTARMLRRIEQKMQQETNRIVGRFFR